MAFQFLKRFFADQLTTANGDYDPARVVGYFLVGLGGMLFLFLEFYTVFIKGAAFDPVAYGDALIKVGAALLAAAAGVWMKHGSEVPYTPPADSGTTDPAAAATATATADVGDGADAAGQTVDKVAQLAKKEIDQVDTVVTAGTGLWSRLKGFAKAIFH